MVYTNASLMGGVAMGASALPLYPLQVHTCGTYFLLQIIHTCHLRHRSMFTVTPGSEQIRATIERDGIVS